MIGFNQLRTVAQTQISSEWAETIALDYNVTPNITYSVANNTELKLDLYLPKNVKAPVPVLLLFHGGGWVAGQKENNIFWLMPYFNFGWAVANVEYRLAKNSLAPAAVIDTRCALRWIASNAKRFNIDPAKIVLTGTSAGGHLALITGMLPENNFFDRACPTPDSLRWRTAKELSVKVAAIINWFGITDVANLLEGPDAKHYAIEWFGSMSNRMEIAKDVSPINYIHKDVPPILTLHGDKDDIVPYSQAIKLHNGLDKVGIQNQLYTVIGAGHGGFNREQTLICWAIIKEFLNKNNLLK